MTDTATHNDTAGDNLFGVCAAIGDEFGFNPLWLRLAFAVTFLADPEIVAGTYFALGVIVLLSRLVAPKRKLPAAPIAAVMPVPTPVTIETYEELPLAA